MFTYESGVFWAFLIWIYTFAAGIIASNSIMEKNMNKIGMTRNWFTGQYRERTSADQNRSVFVSCLMYLALMFFNLITTLGSWMYVGLAVVMWLYRLSKDSGVPQNVKEYRWKMKNLDLSFDDILRLVMETTPNMTMTFEQFRD